MSGFTFFDLNIQTFVQGEHFNGCGLIQSLPSHPGSQRVRTARRRERETGGRGRGGGGGMESSGQSEKRSRPILNTKKKFTVKTIDIMMMLITMMMMMMTTTTTMITVKLYL